MKFMPGYQLMADDAYIRELVAQREHIHEVYFSFGDMPNGRGNQLIHPELLPWEAQQKQLADLEALSRAEIDLNLLLNGNCYGAKSLARTFYNQLGDTVDSLGTRLRLTSVTTTSPLIAKFIKENFPSLEIRASVNMKIGTPEGMDYLGDLFDGFYMQREFNRDLEHIRHLKAHCDRRGKRLYLLANSGCLNHCSAQIFHDNLVAHETELAAMDNAYRFEGLCHTYLADEAHLSALITSTNFVRPEDISKYDGLFTAAKLATRVSRDPVTILRSYIRGRYSGNLLNLLEPSHSIYPYVLENGDPPRLVKLDTDIPMYEGKEIQKEETVCSQAK